MVAHSGKGFSLLVLRLRRCFIGLALLFVLTKLRFEASWAQDPAEPGPYQLNQADSPNPKEKSEPGSSEPGNSDSAGKSSYEAGLAQLLGASGTKDISAAIVSLKQAAQANDPRAFNLLGLIFDPIWKIGEESNSEEAAKYYAAAAGLGFEAANFNLERLIERGLVSRHWVQEFTNAASKTEAAAQTAQASQGGQALTSTVLSSKEIFQRVAPAVVELKTLSNYGSGVILGTLIVDKRESTSDLELATPGKSYSIKLGLGSTQVPLARNPEGESFLFIVTNAHVVAPATSGSAQQAKSELKVGIGLQGEGESLQIVRAHSICVSQVPQQDLAFVLVNTKDVAEQVRTQLTPAVLYSEGNAPDKGSQVFAIGNPEGLTRTIAQGLYNGVRPEGIQFDAPISVGSSGGALISEKGELLGITTGFVANKDSQNLNFALPSFEIIQNLRLGQSVCQTL